MASSVSKRTLVLRISLFGYFEAILIAVFGWFHTWSPRPAFTLINLQPYVILEMFGHALVVVAPFWCLALVTSLLVRRVWPGYVIVLAAPLLYLLDLLLWLAFDGGVFELQSWKLATTATEWAFHHMSRSRFATPAIYLVLIGISQILMVSTADVVSRLLGSTRKFWRRTLQSALVLGPLFLWYAVWFGHFYFNSENEHLFVHKVAEKRRPIEFFRTWLRHSDFESRESVARVLLPRLPQLIQFEKNYIELHATGPAKEPHDVVLVILECLRADGITQKSAPNLTSFAKRSLNCVSHFSSGNCSGPGAFGLLFGTDAACYPAGAIARWPAALPKILGECGYHRVFLGSGKFDSDQYHNMKEWLAPQFEIFNEGISNPFYVRDSMLIETAVDVLNRRGQSSAIDERPVLVVLYLYTTHFPNDPAAEDFVFTEPGPTPYPPWSSPEEIRGYYLNSIRTIDRLLRPVLESNALVAVTGDHAESFGEDGNFFHGGDVTVVSSHTPMMVSIPGVEPGRIELLTTHSDLLPSIIDAVGVDINNGDCLSGKSLLRMNSDPPVDAQRQVVICTDGLRFGQFMRDDARDLSRESRSVFQGDLWAGSVRVPVGALLPFDLHLAELCSDAENNSVAEGAAALVKIAQTGDVRTRLRALQLLAAYPEYAIPHREKLNQLTDHSNDEISQGASAALTAIDGLLAAE